MTSVRRSAAPAVLAACLLAAAAAQAQQGGYASPAGATYASPQEFAPYYGKNKVIYEKFAWKSYATDHFRIFYYAEDARTLRDVAATAESAYRRIADGLKHEIAEPVPLLFFTTFTDFEQNNIFQISEGVMGVSEPVLHRIGVHGDMSLDELQALITHELTHVFEFDILWGAPGGALYALNEPPLWTFEGLSEFFTGQWSAWSSLILRDSVLNDRVPEFDESGELVSRYPLPREPAYDFGHALYEFMESRFGRSAVREFFASLKGSSPLLSRRDPVRKAFALSPREFGQEFRKYLRLRFKDFAARENPEDYSVPLGPEFPMNPYFFAFSHALSPSGDIAATITYNALDNDMDIVLISTRDGSVLKNITRGYTAQYETIKYEIDPTLGKSLAWSRDGDRLAFFARDGQKHALFVLDVLTGAIARRIKLDVDQPAGPVFYPDGRKIMFTAFARGQRDVFAVDLAGGAAENLTRDGLYEKAPAISPDGTTVAYSIRVGESDKLFLSPIGDFSRKTQLTFGRGNTVTPEFSPDGKTLYLAGDMRDAYNVYSLALDSGKLRRFTDVRTGNFFPTPLPSDPRTIVFLAFNKGAFQLFKARPEPVAEQILAFAEVEPGRPFPAFEPALKVDINPDLIKAQSGMGPLYISQRPPIDAMVASDGSLYGGSALAFSDILGDHQFSVMAYQVRELRSFALGYLNQKRRFQYALNAFQSSLYYYPYQSYYDPALYALTRQSDAIATRKITGAAISAYYPLSKFTRLEGSFGLFSYEEETSAYAAALMGGYGGSGYFVNGTMLSARFSITSETTRFKAYGPASGGTWRLSVAPSLPAASAFLSNTTWEADLRKYFYVGADALLALRAQGYMCRGRDRFLGFYGGNNQVRSAYYYGLVGTEYWFAGAELRFPLIATASTLIGPIGPLRGAVFADVTRNKYGPYPAKFYRTDDDPTSSTYGGILTFDAIGSFGAGLELFVFGLPIHIEFAKRLEWADIGKPFSFGSYGTYATKFWIGYDF